MSASALSIRVNRFDDVHQHAAAMAGWEQRYDQLAPGRQASSLAQLEVGSVHLFVETLGRRVVQHGRGPRGRVCFALPLSVPGEARIQGEPVSAGSLLVMRGGDEFLFHVPAGTALLGVTVDGLDPRHDGLPGPLGDALAKALRAPVHRIDRRSMLRVRAQLLRLAQAQFTRAAAADHGITGATGLRAAADAPSAHDLAERLLSPLLDLLDAVLQAPAAVRTGSARGTLFAQCHRALLADPAGRPTIDTLCRRFRVSRRTVQNAFADEVAMAPLQYMRALRLNGVRRSLIRTPAATLSVGDAAAAWGFDHLGRFAADYRSLFDELPSQTPRPGRG